MKKFTLNLLKFTWNNGEFLSGVLVGMWNMNFFYLRFDFQTCSSFKIIVKLFKFYFKFNDATNAGVLGFTKNISAILETF